ncbi:hypothetical protein QWY31_16100 [Cytophagales bacterium LB-30]|uniref:6-bladed beta-propeller n=1 Tax=Shiella aurantiaca TaxID=3058365 RepID=A0ABT8F9W0_9BACT|nr:hypothetical protein [Shiella aurantiaca]MDN4167034.1 hypothetical protein [Shiella aurantiaca]
MRRLPIIFQAFALLILGFACQWQEPATINEALFSRIIGNGQQVEAKDLVEHEGLYWVLAKEVLGGGDSSRILLYQLNQEGIQIHADSFNLNGLTEPQQLILAEDGTLFVAGTHQGKGQNTNELFLFEVSNGQASDIIYSNQPNFSFTLADVKVWGGEAVLIGAYTENGLSASNSFLFTALNGVLAPRVVVDEQPNANVACKGVDSGLDAAFPYFYLGESDKQAQDLAGRNLRIMMIEQDLNNKSTRDLFFGTSANDHLVDFIDDTGDLLLLFYAETNTLDTKVYLHRLRSMVSDRVDSEQNFAPVWLTPKELFASSPLIPVSISKLGSGNFLIGAKSALAAGQDLYFMKIDPSGNPLYDQWLPIGGRGLETIVKIFTESDGSVVTLSTVNFQNNHTAVHLTRTILP